MCATLKSLGMADAGGTGVECELHWLLSKIVSLFKDLWACNGHIYSVKALCLRGPQMGLNHFWNTIKIVIEVIFISQDIGPKTIIWLSRNNVQVRLFIFRIIIFNLNKYKTIWNRKRTNRKVLLFFSSSLLLLNSAGDWGRE